MVSLPFVLFCVSFFMVIIYTSKLYLSSVFFIFLYLICIVLTINNLDFARIVTPVVSRFYAVISYKMPHAA